MASLPFTVRELIWHPSFETLKSHKSQIMVTQQLPPHLCNIMLRKRDRICGACSVARSGATVPCKAAY